MGLRTRWRLFCQRVRRPLLRSVGALTFTACLAGGTTMAAMPPWPALAVAYGVTYALARAQKLSHGAHCRATTTVAVATVTAKLLSVRHASIATLALLICPVHWLWWPKRLASGLSKEPTPPPGPSAAAASGAHSAQTSGGLQAATTGSSGASPNLQVAHLDRELANTDAKYSDRASGPTIPSRRRALTKRRPVGVDTLYESRLFHRFQSRFYGEQYSFCHLAPAWLGRWLGCWVGWASV